MSYAVKEMFYTLQGEGANAGRPAVFCRFVGCNLWNGLERDRVGAVCRFCDTDFVGTDGIGGGRFKTAVDLVRTVRSHWPSGRGNLRPFVVCTGGEPALQLDEDLVAKFHAEGFTIAVETNGTLELPATIDWVTVSPKAGAPLRQRRGQEIKVVWPQAGLDLEELAGLDFEYRYLQPLDDADAARNVGECVEACLAYPVWRLSLQTHKLLGIR